MKKTLEGVFVRRKLTNARHPNRWGYLGALENVFPPCVVEEECKSLPELRKEIIDRFCKVHGIAGIHVFRKKYTLLLKCQDDPSFTH